MKVILSFEASDPDWTKDNPWGLALVEVADVFEKEAIVKKVCELVSDYKEQEINWNYQDAIAQATQWLEKEGYYQDFDLERIDLD